MKAIKKFMAVLLAGALVFGFAACSSDDDGGISDKIFEGAKAWFFKKSDDRASYDNMIDMTGSIAGFSGYFLSMIYVPSLRAAFFLLSKAP